MGEDEENRKQVVKHAILFYIGIIGLITLRFPVLSVTFRLFILLYFKSYPTEVIFNWLFKESLNIDLLLYFPRFYFGHFYDIFGIEIFLIIYSIWISRKEVKFEENLDKLTRYFAHVLKYVRSIRIFHTKDRLKKLSESNPNEISVLMTFRELLKPSTIVNFTIAYGISKILLLFYYPVYPSYEIFWVQLALIVPIPLIFIYTITLTSLPIFWHKQLGIKILNDVIPFEKLFRYGSFVVIMFIFYDVFGVFGLAALASLETFNIFIGYNVILIVLITHIFLSFLLVNVAMYAKGSYRIRLIHAAKGLLEISGAKKVYYGAQEYYNEHPEEV